MRQRSNLIVVIGLAVFLVGAAAAYLIVRDEGSSSASTGTRVTVLYADRPIPAGTRGNDALSQGLVRTKQVSTSAKPASALVDGAQLTGRTATVSVPGGSILVAEQFQQAQTAIGTVKIPQGKQALAIQLANVPGVAGFAGAGDVVDIFAAVKSGVAPGRVHLVAQAIEVLNVNGTQIAATQGQPGGAGLVFLLAVTPNQAEHLIYLSTFEQLYFSLLPRGTGAGPQTPGVTPADALNPAA